MADLIDLDRHRKKLLADTGLASQDDKALQEGGGGGTYDDMEAVDAKIAASEARTDTKFAELRGELKALAGKGTVWGAAGSLFVGVLAVLAFAGDRFDAGMGTAETRQAQLARDNAQDATASDINNKLDLILAGQASAKPPR